MRSLAPVTREAAMAAPASPTKLRLLSSFVMIVRRSIVSGVRCARPGRGVRPRRAGPARRVRIAGCIRPGVRPMSKDGLKVGHFDEDHGLIARWAGFRALAFEAEERAGAEPGVVAGLFASKFHAQRVAIDRKSIRLNSSHLGI